jgi:tetratricopeptide (TPR) repeat protein
MPHIRCTHTRLHNTALSTLLLVCTSLIAQSNPHDELRDALLLEQQGKFEMAIDMAKLALESNQLSGIELSRAYIILGVLYDQVGRFPEAKAALERSLHSLEHDPDHVSNYVAALNAYGDLYSGAGRLDVAKTVWVKALHLRRRVGENGEVLRSLLKLAHLALMRKRMHEAERDLKQASDVVSAGHDLIGDDFVLLFETQGSLAVSKGHKSEAIADFGRALELCRRLRGEEHWLTGWEHMLRGKAYAQSGDMNAASVDMQEGLAIMEHTLARENTIYVAAQIAYSEVLDGRGLHAEAAQLRTVAEQTCKHDLVTRCTRYAINITALR